MACSAASKLITVDPVSSAILKIELVNGRTADKWIDHLKGIVDNGFSPRLLTSDAGTALKSAHEQIFSDINKRQNRCHEAEVKENLAVDLYEGFSYLYKDVEN